jgi:hypothetical protein
LYWSAFETPLSILSQKFFGGISQIENEDVQRLKSIFITCTRGRKPSKGMRNVILFAKDRIFPLHKWVRHIHNGPGTAGHWGLLRRWHKNRAHLVKKTFPSGYPPKRLSFFIPSFIFEFTVQGRGNGFQSLCAVRHTLQTRLLLLRQGPTGVKKGRECILSKGQSYDMDVKMK